MSSDRLPQPLVACGLIGISCRLNQGDHGIAIIKFRIMDIEAGQDASSGITAAAAATTTTIY